MPKINKTNQQTQRLATYRAEIQARIARMEFHDSDFAMVEAFVEHYAIWRTAIDAVKDDGIMVATPRGFMQKNPALSIADNEAEILKKLANELALSAKAKKSLGIEDKQPSLSDLVK